MEQIDLCGTGVALVTPFNDDRTIDYQSLGKMVDHVTNGGVDYLVVMGTTGESVTISKEEKKQIADFILERNNGRLPVVLGIGGYNTVEVADTIKNTDLSSFQAILSVSPYYNKPNQKGIYQHYKYIAGICDKPIVLYNVPGRTGKNIATKTTLRLAEEIENIVAIKEASGDLCQVSEIIRNKPERFKVISGDDALTLPILALGGCGVISVIANALPSRFSNLVNLANDDKIAEARKIHHEISVLNGLLFEEGSPAGIKAALYKMGLIKNNVRLPLVTASDDLCNKIEKELKAMGVL